MALAGCLALLACGGGGAEAGSEARATAGTAASSDRTHAHEDGDDHAHGQGAHEHAAEDTLASGVTLEPAGGGAWTGSATVLAVGDSVRILASIEDAPAGSRFTSSILAGGCEEDGSDLASLTPVTAGSSGAGSAQTTLPIARLDGREHGAIRMTSSDGSQAACAPVHLSASGHDHG